MGKVRRPFNVTAVDTLRTNRLKCHIRYRKTVNSLLDCMYFLIFFSQLSIPNLLIAPHFSFVPVFVPHFYFIRLIDYLVDKSLSKLTYLCSKHAGNMLLRTVSWNVVGIRKIQVLIFRAVKSSKLNMNCLFHHLSY
jgi:hypothetical protein